MMNRSNFPKAMKPAKPAAPKGKGKTKPKGKKPC